MYYENYTFCLVSAKRHENKARHALYLCSKIDTNEHKLPVFNYRQEKQKKHGFVLSTNQFSLHKGCECLHGKSIKITLHPLSTSAEAVVDSC